MNRFTYEQREWLKDNMLRKEMLLIEDLMVNERAHIDISWDDYTEGVWVNDINRDGPNTYSADEAATALLCEAARFNLEHGCEQQFTTYAEAVKLVPEFGASLPEQMQRHDRGFANPWCATEFEDIESHDIGDGTLEYRIRGWDRVHKTLAEAETRLTEWRKYKASQHA